MSLEAEKILLVDDDEIFRARLAKALLRRGFACREANDHTAALEAARCHTPTHAVVDLRMPGKDGLEVVRDLMALIPQLKILVLTGFGSIPTAVEAMRLGASHYLTKPADADEILAALFQNAPPKEVNLNDADVPSLARVEWEHIQRVLKECEGNISKTARLLGMHRRSLQRKLSKYPIAR